MILGRSKAKGQGGKEGRALRAVDPQRRLCHSSIRVSVGGANTINPRCPQSPKFLSVQSSETLDSWKLNRILTSKQTLTSVGGRTAPGCYSGFMLTWRRDLRREPRFERQPHPRTLSSQSLNQQCPSLAAQTWLVETRLADRPGSRSLEEGRQRERGRDRETVGWCFSSIRQTGPPPPPPPLGCGVSAGAAQGLAGGLGEGQEPWLSKLAVLAFHCRRQGHQETDQRPGGTLSPFLPNRPLRNLPPSRTSWAPAGGASERWACADTPASRSSGPCRVPRRCSRPSSRR